MHVWSHRNVSDAGLTVVASKCDLLSHVCLDNCPLITDNTVFALATGCPELHTIRLAWCVAVSDAALIALCEAKCARHLKWVDVSSCRRVSDAGLEQLTQRAQNIERLNVACCRNLTWRSLVTVRWLWIAAGVVGGRRAALTARVVVVWVAACAGLPSVVEPHSPGHV